MTTVKPFRNERELLQKVAKGDQRAFRILYDRYSKKVYLFSLRILNSDLLAEEVMQTTMLKLWQMEEKLTGIRSLEAYLKTASRNACFNVLRKQKVEQKIRADLASDWKDASNETEELIQLNETQKVIQEAVDALPLYHRKVYRLCHQEGLKYEEAALRLNLSPHTIRSYMKLTLRFLRKYVSNDTDAVFVFMFFFIYYLP